MTTKLTKIEKQWLKTVKANYPRIMFGRFGRLTVAIEPAGPNRGKFAISIASNEETKIRRKVGQFWALSRLVDGQSLPIELPNGFDINEIAENMFYNLCE